MVRKTKNHRNVSENRKKNKKRVTRKRRGGKKKRDAQWEEGFWSEEPTIHATFKTQGKTNTPECEYSLMWNYHYLDEDDSIPLEKPKDGKDTRIKKREILQIFTNSENSKTNKKLVGPEDLRYRNCTLKPEKVLELLKYNDDFQEKVKHEKTEIEEMVKYNREQKEFIKKTFKDKSKKVNDYIVKINKEIKDIFDKNNPKK